mgnify:CR=1 FL=1
MAVQNSLAKKQQKTGMATYLTQDAVKKQINSIVGGKNGARFISSIVSAVQTTPALQECTNPSILSAALLGEALNLSPSPQLGQYYMVPYNNRKTGHKEAQFQLGYKGYLQLAEKSISLRTMWFGKKRQLSDIMRCSSMRMGFERRCTGQRKRCWHMRTATARHST